MKEKGLASSPLLLGIPLGMVIGVGLFTFGYAKGGSYMTNDPEACRNCHVMNEQFDGWLRSSHRKVAVCNDCHTPPGFFAKYLTKAENGFHHSWAFTTGWFPDRIRITGRNAEVTQRSCMKCHEQITDEMRGTRAHSDQVQCTSCHRNVGHAH
jgi:cytochrome c nitrite reductase small subunit